MVWEHWLYVLLMLSMFVLSGSWIGVACGKKPWDDQASHLCYLAGLIAFAVGCVLLERPDGHAFPFGFCGLCAAAAIAFLLPALLFSFIRRM